MTGSRVWLAAIAAAVALALVTEATFTLSGGGVRDQRHQPTPSAPTAATTPPVKVRAPWSLPMVAPPFMLRPPAGETPGAPSGPNSGAAVDVAARWAVAFTAGDTRWRQLVTAVLAARFADQSPGWPGARAQWASPAAVTASSARVYVYVTATVAGVDVAASYDCELALTGSAWQVVGVLA